MGVIICWQAGDQKHASEAPLSLPWLVLVKVNKAIRFIYIGMGNAFPVMLLHSRYW